MHPEALSATHWGAKGCSSRTSAINRRWKCLKTSPATEIHRCLIVTRACNCRWRHLLQRRGYEAVSFAAAAAAASTSSRSSADHRNLTIASRMTERRYHFGEIIACSALQAGGKSYRVWPLITAGSLKRAGFRAILPPWLWRVSRDRGI